MADEMLDNLWFAPFHPRSHQTLRSIYSPDPAAKAVARAQPFTISLETAMVGPRPPGDLLSALFSSRRDVLLTSAVWVGSKPQTRRVHYYSSDLPTKSPLRSFLADIMYCTDDYSGERLYLEVKIVEVGSSSEEREAMVRSFQGLAATFGAVFPVVLPYTAVASGLATTINKVMEAVESEPVMVLSHVIDLWPLPNQNRPLLQTGRYVAFPNEIDGSKFKLSSSGTLLSTVGRPVTLPYVVFRVDTDKEVAPDFVVTQRVATLLTQLADGNKTNAIAPPFQFLQETLDNYSVFEDLKRYKELAERDPKELTEQERGLMERLAKRERLKPYLPKPS